MVPGAIGSVATASGAVTDGFLLFHAAMWALTLGFAALVDRVRAEPADTTDPLFLLQRRYARGEIDDATFERTLDRLLVGEALERSRVDVAPEVPLE